MWLSSSASTQLIQQIPHLHYLDVLLATANGHFGLQKLKESLLRTHNMIPGTGRFALMSHTLKAPPSRCYFTVT